MSRYKEPIQQKESIKTCVRIRPILSPNEEKVFYLQDDQTIVAKTGAKFTYNRVFDDKKSTEQIYDVAAKPIIRQSLKGFNGCIMAYGQTSSGKTHTMKGTIQQPGIVPLALADIFDTMTNEGIEAKVQVAYMEIYNEKVYDLLANQVTEIQIQSNESNLFFTGLNIHWVENFEQAIGYFNKGQEKRKFDSNIMNLNSSRSHTIFRINISVLEDTFEELNAQIDLVDLAGSEGIDKTKDQKVSRFQGQNINKSLLALSKVITLLSEKKDDKAISFRDSKLTRILQKSLVQNAKSSIICMINPNEPNLQESLNTLKFGQNALKIKIEARQNINRTVQPIKQPYVGRITFLPSERIELEEARATLKQNQIYIRELNDRINELDHANYKLEGALDMAEIQLRQREEQFKSFKEKHTTTVIQWERDRQRLINRIQSHEGEILRLQKLYDKARDDLRIVEKNQQSLVMSQAHSENLCIKLNQQIRELTQQINQQTNKLSKIKTQKKPLFQQKPKLSQKKKNPFHLPPFDPNRQAMSPNSLTWIIRLKTEVVELSHRVESYTKANFEIAEQLEELRKKNDELEEQLEKKEVTGKINPESLEYREIQKHKKKIASLKQQLRLSQINEKKYRDILKKDSARSIAQIEEFEEWFEKKYSGNVLINKEVQTDIVNLTESLSGLQTIRRIETGEPQRQKMEIEVEKIYNPLMQAVRSPTKSQQMNWKKGQTVHHQTDQNDNPEQHSNQPGRNVYPFGQNFSSFSNNNFNTNQRQNMSYQTNYKDSESNLLSNTPKREELFGSKNLGMRKDPSTKQENDNSQNIFKQNNRRSIFEVKGSVKEDNSEKDIEI